MNVMYDVNQEEEIKKYDKTLPVKVKTYKPRENAASKIEKRSLYSSRELKYHASDFDFQKESEIENDLVVKAQSPALLAFRNNNTRANIQKPRTKSTLVLSSPNPTKQRGMTPMEINKKRIDQEKLSLNIKENPIAYFYKRKDGGGHLFISFNFSRDRDDPLFSPYELVKVPTAELNPEYFTMSAAGVTHVYPNGESDHISLDKWASEASIYNALRSLKLFGKFRYWKPFRILRNFLHRRRYKKISASIKSYPFFTQPGFYSTLLDITKTSCAKMIKKYLISFVPQRKYTLEAYQKEMEQNTEKLNNDYQNYLENVLDMMLQLDGDIRDPSRILVKDNDFKRSKNININLGQLLEIRTKVEEEKIRRKAIVNNEVKSYCRFIRMVDHLLLESISQACYESWKIADSNVSQEMSSVFQITLYFTDDGDIAFTPTLDELLDVIKHSLNNSVQTLNKLPRIISQPQIRIHLREEYDDVGLLIDEGPHFDEIHSTNSDYPIFYENILEVFTVSYHESKEVSKCFKDFYRLYKTGKGWSPQDYIKPRGGESHYFYMKVIGSDDMEIDEKDISFDPSTELVVDFDAIRNDVADFRSFEAKLSVFHPNTVRGALYIDSKDIRGILTTIPMQSICSIQNSLKDLIQKKNDDINKIFRFCAIFLKKEPETLENYIYHCEFLKKVLKMDPFIQDEISFVDKLYQLLEDIGCSGNSVIENSRNSLHDGYISFKNDQEKAVEIKERNSDKFTQVLNERINKFEMKLYKYSSLYQNCPSSINEANMDYLIPMIEKIKQKILMLEPDINTFHKSQSLMGLKINDLSHFNTAKNEVLFTEQLYQALQSFKQILDLTIKFPFSTINMDDFSDKILKINDEINDLMISESFSKDAETPQRKILNEMNEKITSIIPFLDLLKLLSESKMNLKYWNQLFGQCNQNSPYYEKITISELISYGVLNDPNLIRTITFTANGEAQLEIDFQSIVNHWKEVKLPIAKNQQKGDDMLLLDDLSSLFADINDTQLMLNRMLLYPYSTGIKDSLLKFSSLLNYYIRVLDEWAIFQSNWIILRPLFKQEVIREKLPQLANKFAIVKRKWTSIVRYSLDDTSLEHVFSFPSLYETIIENNKMLRKLLLSTTKIIDIKREIIPRLYFLSDNEALMLYSNNEFNIMVQQLKKLFMKVDSFVTCESEKSNGEQNENDGNDSENQTKSEKSSKVQTLSKIQICGINGNSLNSLKLKTSIPCDGPLENWIKNLIEAMKDSLKHAVLDSIQTFKDTPLEKWIKTYPIYVIITALHIIYRNNAEKCVNHLENDANCFHDFTNNLIELHNTLSQLLRNNELIFYDKHISEMIITIQDQIDITNSIAERIQNFSEIFNWTHSFKLRMEANNKMYIDFDDVSIEHGYEFYGSLALFIQSHVSQRATKNICYSLKCNSFPFLFGSAEVGKKHLISSLAALYGQFLYILPGYFETNETLINRMLLGVISNGSWLVFYDFQYHTKANLNLIYNFLKEFQAPRFQNEGKIMIEGKIRNCIKTARIIFMGPELIKNSFMDNSFPPQLKNLLKPVSLGTPETHKVIKIRLFSYGFTEYEIIATKLINLISTIVNIFSYIPAKSILSTSLKIIEEAHSIVQSIKTKSLSATFIENLDSQAIIEKYSITYALYRRFLNALRRDHQQTFLQTIYSYFPLFNSFEQFSYNLAQRSEIFEAEFRDKILRDSLRLILKNQEFYSSSNINDYLIDKMIAFYNLIYQYPIVIISGPPCSGKTSIIELLGQTFELIAKKINNNDFHVSKDDDNQAFQLNESALYFQDIKPFKIFDIYHHTDEWGRIFGEMVFDKTNGNIWHCGELQTWITNLMKYQNTHEIFLRFNGPLSHSFVNFIQQLGGCVESSYKSGGLRLNTLDLLSANTNIHLIIETDNISNISPTCLRFCGILNMVNINSKSITPGRPSIEDFELSESRQFLKRVLSVYKITISDFLTEIIFKDFPSIVTEVIKYVYKTPNFLYDTDSNMRTRDCEVIIVEHLTYLSLLYMFYYLDTSEADKANEQHIKTIMILSIFTIFSSIVDFNSTIEFDNWIRSTFKIEIPQDWIGFKVNQKFWDYFPGPSMMSLYFHKGELLPHIQRYLEEPPLVDNESQNSIKSISICVTAYLPLIFQGNILINNHQNFILFGPSGSGKSTLLKFILRDQANSIISLIIPVNKYSTKKSLQSYIKNYSYIFQKQTISETEDKTFVLIFDNVPPDNLNAIEFIRMLVSVNKLPVMSKTDPKYLEFLYLRKFMVIVTCQTISNFNARFLSKFFLMKLDNPSSQTIKEIYEGLGKYFHVNNTLINNVYSVTEKFKDDRNAPFHFLSLINILPVFSNLHKNSISDNTNSENINTIDEQDSFLFSKLLLCQLNLTFIHRIIYSTDVIHPLVDYLETLYNSTEYHNLIQCILNNNDILYYEIVSDSRGDRQIDDNANPQQYTFRIETTPIVKIKEKLENNLSRFNSHNKEKLNIKFTQPVINQWSLLLSALSIPGNNILLIGNESSGRYSLARFIASTNEYPFINIPYLTDFDCISFTERHLFISNLLKQSIKDCSLTPKPTIIFLKVNDYSSDDIELLSYLYKYGNPTPFLTHRELNDMFDDIGIKFGIQPNKKLEILMRISQNLKESFHFIFSVNEANIISNTNMGTNENPDSKFNSSYGSNPHSRSVSNQLIDINNFSLFTKIEFQSHCSSFIRDSSKGIVSNLTNDNENMKLPDNLFPTLISIHEMIRKRLSSQQIFINSYYDFLELFNHFYTIWRNDITSISKNYINALSFFDKLKIQATDLQQQLSEMKTEITNQKDQGDKIQQSLIGRKGSISARLKNISNSEQKFLDEIDQIKAEIKPIKIKLNEAKLHVDLAKSNLNAMPNISVNSLLPFVDDPPPVFKFVMNLLSSMLNQPKSYGKKLFKDEKLVQIITKQIDPVNMEDTVLSRSLTVYQQSLNVNDKANKFDSKDAAAMSPALTPFFDWAISTIQLALLNHELKEKLKIYEARSLEFRNFQQENAKERNLLRQESESLSNEITAYRDQFQQLKIQESSIGALQEKQKVLEQILHGLDHFIEKWKNSDSIMKEKESKLIGNTIIFSAFLCYSGLIISSNIPNKKEFLNLLHEIVSKNGFENSLDNYNSLTFLLMISNQDSQFSSMKANNPTFQLASSYLLFLSSVYRTPLILDPDGIFKATLIKLIGRNSLCLTSLLSQDLFNIFEQCMKEGKTLILEDVNFLHPFLSSILPTLLHKKIIKFNNDLESENDDDVEIEFFGKTILMNHSFKLFLFSSIYLVQNIPDDLLSRVTIVDISNDSLETIRNIVQDIFINEFIPQKSSVFSKENELLQYKFQSYKYEKELLDIINEFINHGKDDEDYDFLCDENLLMDFYQCKDNLLFVEKRIQNLNNNKENDSLLKPFYPCIERCCIAWEAISRFLPKFGPALYFSFPDFTSAIRSGIKACNFQRHSEEEVYSEAQLSELQRIILIHLLDIILPSLTFREVYLLLFYIVFKIRIYNGLNEESELNFMIDYFVDEYNKPYDMKYHETKGEDSFHQLRCSNIGAIFDSVTKFISDEFGKNFLIRMPVFSLDAIDNILPNVPILIKINYNSPMLLFDEYLISHGKPKDSLFYVSLSNTNEKSIQKAKAIVKKGIDNNGIIVIHIDTNNFVTGAFLNDTLRDFSNAFPSDIDDNHNLDNDSNFASSSKSSLSDNHLLMPDLRLIIISKSVEFIPSRVLSSCKIFEYENFPSIKQQMMETYHHFGKIVNNQKSDVRLRKLLYMEALTFSLIRYRSLLHPFGFMYSLYIDESVIKTVIDETVKLYERFSSESSNQQNKSSLPTVSNSGLISKTSIGILRKFIMGFVFNGIISDEIDLQKVQQFLDIDPEENGFLQYNNIVSTSANSASKSHNEINKEGLLTKNTEAELWEIPKFNATSTAHKSIQRLPHFPTGEIIMINSLISTPIIQWNLSRWICEPFLDFKDKAFAKSMNRNKIIIQLESLRTLFPSDVDLYEHRVTDVTPMIIFMRREAEEFNSSMMAIRQDIHNLLLGLLPEVLNELLNEKIPQRWCETVGYNGSRNLSRFLAYLKEKADFLTSWLRVSTFSSAEPINCFYIRNIKGLFHAFINEISMQRHIEIDSNDFYCELSSSIDEITSPDSIQNQGPYLILTNIWLLGGNWGDQQKSIIDPNNKTLPLKCFPKAIFVPKAFYNLANEENNEETHPYYNCPLYLSIPCQQFSLQHENETVDGYSKNYVCSVKIRTMVSIKSLISNSVSLVCHIPVLFVS